MRRVHPLWRGFWLSLALTATLVLLGGTDELAAYRFDRRMLALAGAVMVGGFLAALPSRLRRRREVPVRPSWKRCLLAFGGGLLLPLALSLAGESRILPALMQGSTGAYAFLLTAWPAGFITARLMGRRTRA